MIRKYGFYSLLGTALLLMASPVMAAHFTFKVPVEMHKLRNNVMSAHFQCAVYDDKGAVVGQNGKTVSINRQTGEYVSTVVITVDAAPGKSAFDARNYKCFLGLMQAAGANPPKQLPGPGNPNIDFQPAANTAFVREISGNLPGTVQRQTPRYRSKPGILQR